MSILALLSKFADRPSTIWRLCWLLFCLTIMCFFGPRTLRRISPYVLAGVGETPTAPLLAASDAGRPDDDGWLATWVLPAISWLILAGVIAWLML